MFYGNSVEDIAERRLGGALVGVVYDDEPDRVDRDKPGEEDMRQETGESPASFGVAKMRDLEHIVAMRNLFALMIVLFAAPAFGQDVKTKDAKPASFITQNWSKLGPATEGPKGFTLHGRDIRLNSSGQYELWVKIMPANASVFNKRYDLPKNTAFVLQYATVNCEKKLLLFEKTSLYDSANAIVDGRVTGLTPSSRKDSVRPGSIGESVYKNVCVDPTTLPKSEQSKLQPQTDPNDSNQVFTLVSR